MVGITKCSLAVAAASLMALAVVGPPAHAAPTMPETAVPAAAKHPVPDGTTYWRVGSRLFTLERNGEVYWYVSGGTDFSCEAGSFEGYRTSFGWVERVAGRIESGNSTGRMWLSGGRLQYRNAAMNNYSAKPAPASKANRKKGAKAMSDCMERFE